MTPKPRRIPFKRPGSKKGKPVTICIAAACESGKYIVSAVDSMLSYGDLQGDVGAHKIMWMGEWQLMFAGELGNANRVREELGELFAQDSKYLTRRYIQEAVRKAYKKRFAEWSSSRFLSQYDLSMGEFLKEGRAIFGDDRFSDLTQKIENDAVNYTTELIVCGFGAGENSAMIYSINRDGDSSNSLAGWASIGSGRDVATTILMLSGYTVHCSLEEAIYFVAASKFAAENVAGIGKQTTLTVMQKRDQSIDPPKANMHFIQPDQIDGLRKMWESEGRMRKPKNLFVSVHDMIETWHPMSGWDLHRSILMGEEIKDQGSMPSDSEKSKPEQ